MEEKTISPHIDFMLNEKELVAFKRIMKQNPDMTKTAIVKHRVFNYRSRQQEMSTVDLVFLSELKNSISCLLSDARKGIDIVPHVKDLEKLVNDKLGM